MKYIRTALPFVIACFGVFFSMSALAQYMWLDASGRKVFSDQPPPNNISLKNIKKQPGKTADTTTTRQETPTAATADAASSTTATNEKPAATTSKTTETKPTAAKDKDLEAAKKKLDDEAAAKKKAEQEKVDLAKAENCKRAKSTKATLDSGMRLAHTNDKGERGIMDDASRMVETKRLEGIMATDCK